MLPEKKTPKKEDLRDHVVMVYGPPGVGKTTFGAGIPDAIFLAFEPGLSNQEVFQIPIKTWADVKVAYDDLKDDAKSKDRRFKTVIVDTADAAFKMAEDAVVAEKGVSDASDDKVGFGILARLATDKFMNLLKSIHALGYGLVVLAHQQDKSKRQKKGETHKTTAALPDRARNDLMGWVSIIGMAVCRDKADDTGAIVGKERVVFVSGDEDIDAKDRTNKLPNPVLMRWSVWVKAFERKPEPKAPRAPVPEEKPVVEAPKASDKLL